DRWPVETVSWWDIQGFLRRTGLGLPSEAQWEYAGRVGNDKAGDYDTAPRPVGEQWPDDLGVHDLNGNVYELCKDCYAAPFWSRTGAAGVDTVNRSDSGYRVIRGGSIYEEHEVYRPSARVETQPGARGSNVGFRAAFGPLP